MGLTHMYDNMDKIDIHAARDHLHSITTHQWATDIENVPKLRTYRTFKNSYETEPYVYKVFNRAHRSILANSAVAFYPLKLKREDLPKYHKNLDYVYYVIVTLLKTKDIFYLNVVFMKILETPFSTQ